MNQTLDINGFIHAAADAIIAAAADGKIIFWNPAAARIFGFTPAEALGQTLDLIVPERFRARHWEGYRRVMSTGASKYQADVLCVPARHKDGQQLSIAFSVTLLDSPASGERVIAAIVRDETARWNEEREHKRRLTELEQSIK